MENNNFNTSSSESDLYGTMILLTEKMQKIYQFYNDDPHQMQEMLLQFNSFGDVYQEYFKQIMADPTKMVQMQASYWQDYLTFWQDSFSYWSGEKKTEQLAIHADPKDKRFRDEAWKTHPLFNFIVRFYLLLIKQIENSLNEVEGLDEKTEKKVRFLTQRFIEAMAPSNFVLSNPEVWQTTIKTGGKNLVKGLDNLLADLERNNGRLQIRMTDPAAFVVGKNVAVTPGKVIFQNELMQLIQYQPTTREVYRRPILIVPAWINKYYVLDLSQENSFVKWLVGQGYTVFMISWINPDERHAQKEFQDYLSQGTLAALDVITKITGEVEINTIGYCIGGTLLGCTLAYLAAKNDSSITSATYLTTMLDFSSPGDLGIFIDEEQIASLEQQMFKKGYLDGGSISMTFSTLRANDLIWSYFVKNYLQGEDPLPLDFLAWNADATNLPARMHSFYLRNMYLRNLLVQPDGIKLLNVPIDLTRIKTPAYFVSAEQDHVAPWKTTFSGFLLHSGPKEFLLAGSGHIAGIINSPNKMKYHYFTNEEKTKNPEIWLKNSTKHVGSWWKHWEEWLKQHSGNMVTARQPGGDKFPPLQDAPGSYVSVRLKNCK